MMNHFAKLKGCIVGKQQKEAFQKTRSTLLIHKILRTCIYDANSNRNTAFSVLYCVNAHFHQTDFIPPREYRWENYTLMGNYYSQYEDVAKV